MKINIKIYELKIRFLSLFIYLNKNSYIFLGKESII